MTDNLQAYYDKAKEIEQDLEQNWCNDYVYAEDYHSSLVDDYLRIKESAE